jgi:hypothetical protein
MKKNPRREHLIPAVSNSGPEQDAVRKRAYELYVDRGMEDGHDLEDWFHAEQELAARRSQSAAA